VKVPRRIFNVLGQAIDSDARYRGSYWPIHRPAPDFAEQDPTPKIFERASSHRLDGTLHARRQSRTLGGAGSARPSSFKN